MSERRLSKSTKDSASRNAAVRLIVKDRPQRKSENRRTDDENSGGKENEEEPMDHLDTPGPAAGIDDDPTPPVLEPEDPMDPEALGDEEADEVASQASTTAYSQAGDVPEEGKKAKKEKRRKTMEQEFILQSRNPPEIQRMLIEGPFVHTNYPNESCSIIERYMLSVTGEVSEGVELDGKFKDLDKCVFCNQVENDDGDWDLVYCDGMMNGFLKEKEKKVKCRSLFHLSCARKYKAHGYHFQYSALPECQNKLLCPLHNCSDCNGEGRKQSAHEGILAECVHCLRAFHSDTCLPVGSVELDVNVDFESRVQVMGMIICPWHANYPAASKAKAKFTHTGRCNVCGEEKTTEKKDLKNCKTCIRSFHPGCRETKIFDGQFISKDEVRCEFCLCKETIKERTPVLTLWNRHEWWAGIARGWDSYPSKFREADKLWQKPGYVVVEWKKAGGANDFSIMPVRDVVPLKMEYMHLIDRQKSEGWENIIEEHAKKPCRENVLKEVNKNIRTCKHHETATPKISIYDREVCPCKGPNRCSTEECPHRQELRECPPECDIPKGRCNNQRIAKKVLSQKFKLSSAKGKGFGIFATEDIDAGEFLGEYAGEMIGRTEKEKRVEITQLVGDSEANHYMMDIAGNQTIDAARMGNAMRYLNHSCDPNAGTGLTNVFVRKVGTDEAEYEERVFLETKKKIRKGEEITFNYQMEGYSSDNPIKCQCGSPMCKGTMNGKRADSEEKKKEQKSRGSRASLPPLKSLNLKRVKDEDVKRVGKSWRSSLPLSTGRREEGVNLNASTSGSSGPPKRVKEDDVKPAGRFSRPSLPPPSARREESVNLNASTSSSGSSGSTASKRVKEESVKPSGRFSRPSLPLLSARREENVNLNASTSGSSGSGSTAVKRVNEEDVKPVIPAKRMKFEGTDENKPPKSRPSLKKMTEDSTPVKVPLFHQPLIQTTKRVRRIPAKYAIDSSDDEYEMDPDTAKDRKNEKLRQKLLERVEKLPVRPATDSVVKIIQEHTDPDSLVNQILDSFVEHHPGQ